MSKKINVMLVDDSAVIRGLITRTLTKNPDIDIVASVSNGEMAVNMMERVDPDVIVLDIEMPVMDGITAIPLILEKKPSAKILMCSTLSEKGATITMKALSLGATDCIVKPSTTAGMTSGEDFQSELLKLIQTLGGHPEPRPIPQPANTAQTSAAPVLKPVAPDGSYTLKQNTQSDFHGSPRLIAVGSSTGGPQALFEVMPAFKDFPVPIILTQHMPKTFTTILAQHIEKNCGLPSVEGEQDMPLENGRVHVAPGGFHMALKKNGSQTLIDIIDTPPENFCKPSVDPMMRSAIEIYGNKIIAVMLTGMGNDGLLSFTDLSNKGGKVVAQDEKTSVVWGMPGAIAQQGICNEVLPLTEIGKWVRDEAKFG